MQPISLSDIKFFIRFLIYRPYILNKLIKTVGYIRFIFLLTRIIPINIMQSISFFIEPPRISLSAGFL